MDAKAERLFNYGFPRKSLTFRFNSWVLNKKNCFYTESVTLYSNPLLGVGQFAPLVENKKCGRLLSKLYQGHWVAFADLKKMELVMATEHRFPVRRWIYKVRDKLVSFWVPTWDDGASVVLWIKRSCSS